MKTIPLSKGYVALVSDEDYERVSAYKWCAKVDSHTVYAVRSVREHDKQKTINMHRFIMDVTDPKIEVDHKNHDGLDNQRENLRVCSPTHNHANQRKTRGNSQFKGVRWEKGKWRAQIRSEYLGRFTDEIDAAMSYDDAARQHFGPFALTNFPLVEVVA